MSAFYEGDKVSVSGVHEVIHVDLLGRATLSDLGTVSARYLDLVERRIPQVGDEVDDWTTLPVGSIFTNGRGYLLFVTEKGAASTNGVTFSHEWDSINKPHTLTYKPD